MKIQIKRSLQFAATIAVISLTSCAKDSLTPGGVLGDPNIPGNGTATGSAGHSADHQQRQASFTNSTGLNFNYSSKDVLKSPVQTKVQ